MIDIKILEPEDIVEPTDWCRPLVFEDDAASSGSYQDATRTGQPINNFKWVRFDALADCFWFGNTVGRLNALSHIHHEFARGSVPPEHRLDITRYTTREQLLEKAKPFKGRD